MSTTKILILTALICAGPAAAQPPSPPAATDATTAAPSAKPTTATAQSEAGDPRADTSNQPATDPASLEEIATSERAAWQGGYVDHPFLILAQPSLFDPTRAPDGKHTAWAYCHVPNGSRETLVDEVESQVERFAPGFRQVILARHMFTAARMEEHNPNLVGGDINGGAQDLSQLFLRPTRRFYRT